MPDTTHRPNGNSPPFDRRKFLGVVGMAMGAECLAQGNPTSCHAKEPDTGKVRAIRLRPYHPTYVVAYFGEGGSKRGFNRVGMNRVIKAIQDNPDVEVEFVECYDDICLGCERKDTRLTAAEDL